MCGWARPASASGRHNCRRATIADVHPARLAHGFCVVSEHALFAYKCTDLYLPQHEVGVAWNDPALAFPGRSATHHQRQGPGFLPLAAIDPGACRAGGDSRVRRHPAARRSGHAGPRFSRASRREETVLCGVRLPEWTSRSRIRWALFEKPWSAVINCAAYTNVDGAEADERRPARQRHSTGVVAAACAHARVPLVHFSTDYVFAGSAQTPYAVMRLCSRWAFTAGARPPVRSRSDRAVPSFSSCARAGCMPLGQQLRAHHGSPDRDKPS